MTDNLNIRPTAEADMRQVLAMYDHSRTLMRRAGNSVQWVGYPTAEQVRADMQADASFVIEQQGQPVGTFALVPGVEPTYAHIECGRWIDPSTPYATLHRLAKAEGSHGIFAAALRFAAARHEHLRADTHHTNHAMLRLLRQSGFVECERVFMADGSPRQAFEWWRYSCVSESLRQYVQQSIVPQYAAFDAAHSTDHVHRVVARAMQLLPTAEAYVAAAMHDLGLRFGREQHHTHSGRIIRADAELRRWFSDEQIEQIAQAAEDHRASAAAAPRSHLGAVIAEADRDIEPLTIVRRTVAYGLSHYPHLSPSEQWERTRQHLEEKYSERGYIKLWLPNSPNAAPLAELRALIASPAQLRPLFEAIFTELTSNPHTS